uniref:Uncharacterized protein n=1 Tax=Cacopsylla melanoneura TaxID=428564 RepID=A0A8D8YTW6_9HEMI
MLSKLSSLGSNPSTSARFTRNRYATSNLKQNTSSVTRTSLSNTINTSSGSNQPNVNNNNNSTQLFNLSIPIVSDFDHTASLLERINELENSNQRLLNSIEVLTRSLSHLQNERDRPCQCSLSAPAPRPPCTPRATPLAFKRIFIFADSMGRDISNHLTTLIGKNSSTRVFSHIQPGAPFKVIADSVPRMCPDLCQDDVVFVMGGTNDIPELDPDSPSAKALSYNSLIRISGRTNIILNTIPYRYDQLAFHSTNIFHTNCGILFQSKRNNFLSFDNTKFLHRQHFTQHGLHLNRSGKKILAQKFIQFLSEFRGSVPLIDVEDIECLSVCDSENMNQTTHGCSTDSIIHLYSPESRGSNPPVDAISCEPGVSNTPVENNIPAVLSVSVDSTLSSQRQNNILSNSTFSSQPHDIISDIVDISHVNDDLLQDLSTPNLNDSDVLNVAPSQLTKTVKSKSKFKNVLPKVSSFRRLSSPNLGSHPLPTSPCSNSIGRIPALVPSSRSTPTSHGPNFSKEKSKRGT